MFLLTDFTNSPVIRHEYGYYYLYYVAVLIVINLAVLIYAIVVQARWAFRKHYFTKRNRKIIEERKARY